MFCKLTNKFNGIRKTKKKSTTPAFNILHSIMFFHGAKHTIRCVNNEYLINFVYRSHYSSPAKMVTKV